MAELVPYQGKKKKSSGSGTKLCEKIETDDMTAILDMAIQVSTARLGRPAEYPFTVQGLDNFVNKTIDYFEYVNAINANPELERKLIPDIENWAMFLGVTRQTIWTYEQRGGEWRETIQYYKNAIAAVKKQLAMCFKIPPMVYVFDATNNHGYVNSNEFKLSPGTADNSPNQKIADEVRAAGLVWNETTREFEPMAEV